MRVHKTGPARAESLQDGYFPIPVRLPSENLMSWTQEGIGGVDKGASPKNEVCTFWQLRLVCMSLRVLAWGESATLLVAHSESGSFTTARKSTHNIEHARKESALIKKKRPYRRSNPDDTAELLSDKNIRTNNDDNRRTELTFHLNSQPTSFKHHSGLSVSTCLTYCTFRFIRRKSWRQGAVGYQDSGKSTNPI